MPKLSLLNVSGGYSAVDTINTNFNRVKEFLDTLLSRDGTAPNAMTHTLDMNSQRVVNLPDADSVTEPVTKRQLDAYASTSLASFNASAGTYNPSGTGAVARTIAGKLGDNISTKDFGATGITAENGNVPITNLLSVAPLGRRVDIPIGQYRFDAGINRVGPLHIQGEGSGAGPGAVLNTHCSQLYANFLSGDLLYIGPTLYGSIIRDVQFNSGVGQRSAGAAIKLTGTGLGSVGSNYRIQNVAFNNQYDCISLEQCHIGVIENIYCQAWKNTAITSTNNGVNEGAGGTIRSSFFFGGTTSGITDPFIIDTRNGYTRIYDNLLLGSQTAVRLIASTFPVGGFEVTDNWIEEQDIASVLIANSGGQACTMLRINRNEFSVATLGGPGRPNFQSHVSILAGSAGAYLDDVQINDNIMRTTATKGAGYYFIQAASGNNMQICRNILEGLGGNTNSGIYVGPEAQNVEVLDNIIRGTFSVKYTLTAQCNFRDFGSNLTAAEINGITCKNGSLAWCADGRPNSNPLTGGGPGCIAIREGGAWKALRTPTSYPVNLQTGSSYTVVDTDQSVSFNAAGTCTVTLPSASANSGRELFFKTTAAQAVVSAASNVQPLAGGPNVTSILSAVAGRWALLKSDGNNWLIMAAN